MFRFICSLAILLLVGCGKITLPLNSYDRLYNSLISLPNANTKEAKILTKDILNYSNHLKAKYHPIIEPHFNNFLVNIGIQKQGLCYEWSDALYLHLLSKHYKHYKFHLIVSNKGKYWSEHNALAITTPNTPIQQAIIIDLWRKIDDIYINQVNKDDEYRWIQRVEREIIRI